MIKTFNKDSVANINGQQVNLNGVKYTIDNDNFTVVIEPNSVHLIDRQIDNNTFETLINKDMKVVLYQDGINII